MLQLTRNGFSCSLLLDGLIVDDSKVDTLEKAEGTIGIIGAVAWNADTAFTVVFCDNRTQQESDNVDSDKVVQNQSMMSLATLRLCGKFLGVATLDSESQSLSGIIGNDFLINPVIQLSITLLNTSRGEPTIFEFQLAPMMTASGNGSQGLPEAGTRSQNQAQSSSPQPATNFDPYGVLPSPNPLAVTIEQLTYQNNLVHESNVILKESLQKEHDAARYFESSTTNLYHRLPLQARIQYLDSRLLPQSEVSAAMRLNIALSKQQAVKQLEKDQQMAIMVELNSIKKLYDDHVL